ncbi:hypothetical protein [Oceanicola sp. S124]|uniref:hypothetical protein n=1 Tax=Oceanicola sp. S124 TaxID=1042378 RepID=UPI000255A6A7|nr:hypothetical protein [Oceanicola sp. S124]
MSDRPIPFFGPMVRALLEGRKTQTRRVLNPWCEEPPAFIFREGIYAYDENDAAYKLPKTHGVGDLLWVREAWRTWAQYDPFPPRALEAGTHVAYEATPDIPNLGSNAGKYRPGMFMPRWASRLTLIVTDVRVQRLQEISEADAAAEGSAGYVSSNGEDGESPSEEFRSLWDSLNAKRGFGWDANPWVAAYSFRVEKINIDRMGAA